MRLVTNASDLSTDPVVADWLFESSACSERDNPVEILMQRELDEHEDFAYYDDFIIGGN
jgi:hypothetical protein